MDGGKNKGFDSLSDNDSVKHKYSPLGMNLYSFVEVHGQLQQDL